MARYEISQMARARAFRFLALNPDLLNSLDDVGLDLVLDALGIDAQNVINKVAWSLAPSARFIHDTERPTNPVFDRADAGSASISDLHDDDIDNLNDAELDYYLSELGIDPEPTIQSVARLIATSEDDTATDIPNGIYGNSCSLSDGSGNNNAAGLRASYADCKESEARGAAIFHSANNLCITVKNLLCARNALVCSYYDTGKWQKPQFHWARQNHIDRTTMQPRNSFLGNHLAFIGSIGSGKTYAAFCAAELCMNSWLNTHDMCNNTLDALRAHVQQQTGIIPFLIEDPINAHLEEYRNTIASRILRHLACVAHSSNILKKIRQFKRNDYSPRGIIGHEECLRAAQQLVSMDIGGRQNFRHERSVGNWHQSPAECAVTIISDRDDKLFSIGATCNGEEVVNDLIQQTMRQQFIYICYANIDREYRHVADGLVSNAFEQEKYLDKSGRGKWLLLHNGSFEMRVFITPFSERAGLPDDVRGRVVGDYSLEHGVRKEGQFGNDEAGNEYLEQSDIIVTVQPDWWKQDCC